MLLEDNGRQFFGEYSVGTVRFNTRGELFMWSSYKTQVEPVIYAGVRVGDVLSSITHVCDRQIPFARILSSNGNTNKGVKGAANTKECIALLSTCHAERLTGC